MKRLTVNSLKRTKEIITLMLTITVAVGLLPLVSITADASEMYELPYILCMTEESSGLSLVYASSGPIRVLSTSNSTSSAYVKGLASYNTIYMVQIAYNEELGDWVTVKNDYTMYITDQAYYIYGTSTKVSSGSPVYWHMQADYEDYSIITNSAMNSYEQALFAGYSDDLSTFPQGLTESTIQSLIDQQLNTQTEAGETAETLNAQTQAVYTDYQNGERTREEMQVLLEVYAEELNSLEPSTLLDAMQINNALTYNQTIQQIINSTSSESIQTTIMEQLSNVVETYIKWQEGELPLADAMEEMQVPLAMLTATLMDGTAKTTADISAINAALTFAQTICENMSGSQDLNKDVSQGIQESDIAELSYLEQLQINAGENSISDIAPSKKFTQTQKEDAEELLDIIWENEFIKRLVPLCAGFMVVCVALGVKYKV